MSRFAILRGSPMFGWKRTLYKKRSRELSQCLGAFLSISLVASSPFFFLFGRGQPKEMRKSWSSFKAVFGLHLLCLLALLSLPC
jgi:hypothetical protein